jgi:CRISPR/Cas system-associated endoribonuclease Cas2
LEDGGVYIGSEAAFNVLLGGKEDGSERSGAYRHLEKFYKWLQDSFFAFDLSKSEDLEWAQTLVREIIKDENYVI